MKGRISITGTNNANKRNKKLPFKNNAPFKACISKIFNTFVDNAEDPEIVIPMYNLLAYSDNYSMTSGCSWNYYKDEVNDDEDENKNNLRINNNKTTTSKSFEYKTQITRKTPDNESRLDTEVIVPLK